MTTSTAVAAFLLASLALRFGGASFAAQNEKAPAGVKPPTSLVPAPRTDEGSIAREALCIKRAKESEPANVVFVGDSITQGWEGEGKAAWDEFIAPLGALNLGNSGDRTENVLHRLIQAPLTRLQPKHIVLLIGTNNLGHGTSNAEETLAGVSAVAHLIGSQCPNAQIHILEIFPRGEHFNAMRGDITQINQALRALDRGESSRYSVDAIGDAFVDRNGVIAKSLMPDSLHLTAAGYSIWAKALLPIVHEKD